MKNYKKLQNVKRNNSSPMSITAWAELNSKGDILNLHNLCGKDGRKCQNLICFTPKQFEMEGDGFKNTMRKFFKGNEKAWNSFLKLTINTIAPATGMAVGAKSRNPQVIQATANILKSIWGDKVSSITDMHRNGLRLKVMWKNSAKVCQVIG